MLNVACNADCNYHNCNSENTKKYKWYDTDFLCTEQHLNNTNWNNFICHNSSAVLAWTAFIDLLWETIDEFVPHSVTRVQPGKQKSQPWELRKSVSKNAACQGN